MPEILRDCRDQFGLDGITLVASTTANPEIAGFFEKRWYFFRDALSPATILSGGAEPVRNADPLVTNAGFSIATLLGFHNVYLFGVDFGQREGGLHHAKDAVYYQKKLVHLDEQYRKRADRVVAANFGGTVKTFWAYDLGRRMLGELQAERQVNLFNCSDGALIRGATPKVAAAIDLSDVPPDHARVLERVESQMRFFEPGQILDDIDLGAHISGCESLQENIQAFINEVRREAEGFWDVEHRLREFWSSQRSTHRAYFALAYGSMCSMVRLAAFFGNRIGDKRRRKAFLRHFARAYEERCTEMAETSKELLTAMANDEVDLTHDYSAFDRSMLKRAKAKG